MVHMLLPLNYAKPSVIQCPFPRLQVIQIPKEPKSTFFFVPITEKSLACSAVHTRTLKFKVSKPTKLLPIHWKAGDHD